MIEVLYFSDREVTSKLFARVDGAMRPLLVTQVRQDKFARPVPDREPFASFEREFGDRIDQLVLADEGTAEGMWRDPMGDLAERLFPDDRTQAYAAASGYLLLARGQVEAVLKKTGSAADLRTLQDAAARLGRPRPRPPRPGQSASAALNLGAETVDPWALLGIAPGTPEPEAKKAFRNLIAQYHPDKVAHLAPEFRDLAERRTRQILEAWQKIEERSR